MFHFVFLASFDETAAYPSFHHAYIVTLAELEGFRLVHKLFLIVFCSLLETMLFQGCQLATVSHSPRILIKAEFPLETSSIPFLPFRS
jgi:hypothetical protein